MTNIWEDNEEIKIFREYLRIPSVHPNVDYNGCIEFLRRQASELSLSIRVYNVAGDVTKPIAVISWIGTEATLPSIVLNSHMDVVPVFEGSWTHPPFGAVMDEEGRIFARGSQDMKCVGVQYLGAIRALKNEGISLKRTVHVMFVPDEETGGETGMTKFVHSDDFKALNIGFSLDEGIASPNDVFPVFYAERSTWWLYFNVSGTTGHGSLLHKNTAGEKVGYILNKFLEFRAVEVQKLESNPALTIGDVTTVNLTILEGGVQTNVVPNLMKISFDVRLAIDVSHSEFEDMLKRWCAEAGSGIELGFRFKTPPIEPTKIDSTNPFWVAFQQAVEDDLKLKISTQVFTGATDSRYIRSVGIPAIGFSPINNTPILLHDNDEFLRADTYLRGIEIYKKIILSVANA